jgi:hypothetical protein
VDQLESCGRQRAECIEECDHHVSEVRRFGWPSVDRIETGFAWIDEVKDLLVIATPLGELTIEVTERVLLGTHDCDTHRSIGIEERSCRAPSRLDECVESMAGEQEKTVIATCGVKCVE